MSKSQYEDILYQMFLTSTLPVPVRHFHPWPKDSHECDFCWPTQKLIVEVEGGIWIGGRHVHPSGFIRDIAKYNRLTLDGYRLLRVTTDMVLDGKALELVRKALGRRD